MRISTGIFTALIALGAISMGCAHSPHGANTCFVEGDSPPANARFTLFCDVIRGPDHLVAARKLQTELAAQTGIQTWHIVHNQDESVLLCGYYRSFDASGNLEERARAQAERQRVANLNDGHGNRRFRFVIFVPIDRADPEAPAKWNLVNTPPTAYWSLQIGAYREGDRKQMAIDAVRGFREAGVEAFYYHGPTISSVCIGAWPEGAIKKQAMANGATKETFPTLLVFSSPLPPGVPLDVPFWHILNSSVNVRAFAPKLEVVDETLARTIRDYPEHAVDGEVTLIIAGNGQPVPTASFLVVIPRNGSSPPRISPLAVPITAAGGSDR